MARAYAGVLGSLALVFVLARGLVLDLYPNDVLTHGLVVFFTFALIGFCIGYIAEQTVSESVENRFREEMARHQQAAASNSSENTEQ